jgi:predicted nucleic acid-binding protein
VAEVIHQQGTDLHTPALCDVEVASGLRRARTSELVTVERANEVLLGYVLLPLTRHGHQKLLGRILELRHNFTSYDATYVALAEQMEAALLTADSALTRAVNAHTTLSVVQ